MNASFGAEIGVVIDGEFVGINEFTHIRRVPINTDLAGTDQMNQLVTRYTSEIAPDLFGIARAISHRNLAFHYYVQGNFGAAIEQFTLAIPELDGIAKAIYLGDLAYVYYKQGNFDAALTHYTTALAMPELVGEDKAICHYELADVYNDAGDIVASFTHLLDALRAGLVGEDHTTCLSRVQEINGIILMAMAETPGNAQNEIVSN